MPVYAVAFYDVVKALHIYAVVAAFGPPLAYPALFAYARRRHASALPALHDVQLQVNRVVVGPAFVLVLLFGAYMATDRELWGEVWVTIPLVILFVIGGIGGMMVTPAVRTLGETAGTADYDAALQRYVRLEILLAVLAFVAVFFMTTKLGG